MAMDQNNDNVAVEQLVKDIKRSFRPMMNGVVAQSMREKGAKGPLNWGIRLVDLRLMAKQYQPSRSLALALWKENVRECKLLATMLMPPQEMLPEFVDVWVEQTDSQELAEASAFHLYQHLDYAPLLAYHWMASDKPLVQYMGLLVITRLLRQSLIPDERGIHELIDQAQTALQSEHLFLKKAALQALTSLTDACPEINLGIPKIT